MAKIAVILVRGLIGANKHIKDTLKMLNIYRRNVCAILDANKNMLGMVNKVRNYATFGEVSEETIKLLKQKKGESKYYNLNSPRKGYGRKGVKYDFINGGALGYRGEKINDLIKRML
ncbi:MAG: uL30 family ribosomal protein [Nanoarchaeota archaeon]